jgi:hypothetical protein
MAQQKRVSNQVTYEQMGDVGIWSIEDMPKALESGELDKGEEHFREVASQESMTASVIEVGNADSLDKEVLDHINEQWTALGEATNIDAVAYVADGIGRLAISNKNEAEDVETKGFKDRESALNWASDF